MYLLYFEVNYDVFKKFRDKICADLLCCVTNITVDYKIFMSYSYTCLKYVV